VSTSNVALGQEPLESGALLTEVSLSPQFEDSPAAVPASPAVGGAHGNAVVVTELADGLFADLGLPEDTDVLWLAGPALAHRIRSFLGGFHHFRWSSLRGAVQDLCPLI
jgi:hypothetical protein